MMLVQEPQVKRMTSWLKILLSRGLPPQREGTEKGKFRVQVTARKGRQIFQLFQQSALCDKF